MGTTERGFDAFFTAEHPRLVALGVALTGDRDVANDVAQEALLRAYRDWHRVATLDRPGVWARRVALNLLADQRRRLASEARHPAPSAGAVEDGWYDAEFWSAVSALPERQRTAVALYYVLDRSVADVAASMGVRIDTVTRALHQARASLRELLSATGHDQEVGDGR